MEINAVNPSNKTLTNVETLVYNKTPDANSENIAQVSDSLNFNDNIDLSETAKAISEWVSSYKNTFGNNFGIIPNVNADSEIGLVVDKQLLEANQNLLNHLENASLQEKSSKQYQDYVNKLRLYIAKIQNALHEAEQSALKNDANPATTGDAKTDVVNTAPETGQSANDNDTKNPDKNYPEGNSLAAFLTKSIGEFGDKLKEFIMPKGDKTSNETHAAE